MSNNLYTFETHRDLSPAELFLWVALDQTKKQLRFADLAATATWFLGDNDVPISGKMKMASEGTSVISIFLRKITSKRTERRLATVTWKCFSAKGFKFIYTRSLGAFVGRWIPVVDIVFLGYDATVIMYRSIQRFNAMVKPEDRIG